MTRPVVYVAGPIDTGDVLRNLHDGAIVAAELARAGFAPITPHGGALVQIASPLKRAEWLEIGLAHVERADVVLRMPGPSPGADAEVEHARARGIPVVESFAMAALWLRGWRDREQSRKGQPSLAFPAERVGLGVDPSPQPSVRCEPERVHVPLI